MRKNDFKNQLFDANTLINELAGLLALSFMEESKPYTASSLHRHIKNLFADVKGCDVDFAASFLYPMMKGLADGGLVRRVPQEAEYQLIPKSQKRLLEEVDRLLEFTAVLREHLKNVKTAVNK